MHKHTQAQALMATHIELSLYSVTAITNSYRSNHCTMDAFMIDGIYEIIVWRSNLRGHIILDIG